MISPWQKPFRGMQINKAHPLSRGLVGCWVTNEATGDKIFDLSGNDLQGINNGATWGAGGLHFDGNDYVDFGTRDLLTPGTPFTMLALSKYTADIPDSFYPNIIGFRTTSGYHFAVSWARNDSTALYDGVLFGSYSGWDTIKVDIQPEDHKNDLVLFTIVYNGGTASDINSYKLYFNGISQTLISSGAFADAGNYSRIGRAGESANYFTGLIPSAMLYNRALSPEEVAYLHREPYAIFEQPISPAQLYYEAVGDVSTDLLHGKIIIKDSSIVLVDGLIQVKDIYTDLFDGKLQVQDTDTDLADGLINVKDSATDLADGKVQIQDSVIDLADGKVIVTTAGLDTGYADGKIQIKDVTTGIVDGLLKVKDSVTGLVDGKVKIGNIGSNLADGLIRIKDTATGIADGKVQIKDVATGTADGLLKVIEKATSNVDGKLKIKDSIKNLADGKISITGVATAIIRRITIANKKPSYRLVAEQPKPTYRLETENK